MLPRAERRHQLAEIDRRSQQLWALSLMITGSLAFGIALILYPALSGRVESLRIHLRNLPQLVGGLLTLVVLSGIYVVTKQRELTALRNLLIASYMAAAASRDIYPRDSLSNALDRSALPEVLRQEAARTDQTRSPLSLVLLDIRRFHAINEREGNLVGDLVLKELALTLQRTVRQADLVLRYGADQFLCLLVGASPDGGACFLRRVNEACGRVARLRNLSLEAGVAVYQAGGNPEATVAEAERSLARKRQPLRPFQLPAFFRSSRMLKKAALAPPWRRHLAGFY